MRWLLMFKTRMLMRIQEKHGLFDDTVAKFGLLLPVSPVCYCYS
jgi:hypothetical protein